MRIGNRDHHQVQRQANYCNDRRTQKIGPQEPFEAHTTREYRDDLGLVSHLRGKEDDRDKGEQSAELVDEKGDEVDVIGKRDFRQRSFQLDKVIDLLGRIEDHHNHNNQGDSKDVSSEELTHDITVEDFYSWKFELHSLRDNFSTMTAFHTGKVSCIICLRASPTSHK